jgi:anti-sigma factor RsiW
MNQRDLELLSSYLDGQLKPSDSARLESRLSTDPDLRSVLNDLRSARGLLRQLPLRKAPRNFTLTPKMVGKNPPLPRAYPAFRFVTALATLLFFFTVGLNIFGTQLAAESPNFGYGGGGAPEISAAEAPAATEALAATEAPALAPPAAQSAPLPTTTLSAEDAARNAAETQVEKFGVTEAPGLQSQAPAQDAQPVPAEASRPVFVPAIWQVGLVGVALLSALVMLFMRQVSINRWRRK